jgi:hypothetical protein
MTRKTSSTKGTQDDLKYLQLTFQPFTTHTVATLVLGSSRVGGADDRFLARWHLTTARSDFVGHSVPDVLNVLVDMVVHRLRSGSDPADRLAHSDDDSAVGPGAPEGATGGALVNLPLPGLASHEYR